MSTFIIDNSKIPINNIKIKTNKEYSIPNSSLFRSSITENNKFSNNTIMYTGNLFIKNHSTNFIGLSNGSCSQLESDNIFSQYNIFSNMTSDKIVFYILQS